MISHTEIQDLIPHAGAMCLLDEVLEWDSVTLRARSRRYQQADNPLRRADGRLGTACGIELAAQAMALQGRLAAGDTGPPVQGYLASLREVRLATPFLDGPADLLILVTRLLGDADSASYRFLLTRGEVEVLSGRATVLLRPGA